MKTSFYSKKQTHAKGIVNRLLCCAWEVFTEKLLLFALFYPNKAAQLEFPNAESLQLYILLGCLHPPVPSGGGRGVGLAQCFDAEEEDSFELYRHGRAGKPSVISKLAKLVIRQPQGQNPGWQRWRRIRGLSAISPCRFVANRG